jgi:hypothetical protein
MKFLNLGTFIICLCTSLVSSAQITYTKLLDDPSDINLFRVRLPIWVIQPGTANFSAYAAHFGADLELGNKLSLSATYNLLVGDQLMPNSQSGSEFPAQPFVASQFEDQSSRYLHVEGTYYFSNTIEDTEETIVVKSSGNVKYVTSIPAKLMKRTGLRVGYRNGFMWYHTNGSYNFKTADDFIFDTQDQSTYLNYSQIRIGIARAKTTNLHVNLDGYGYRSAAGTGVWYADLIIAMKQELEDVNYYERDNENSVFYSPYEIDQYNDKQKFGFEVGWRWIPFVGRVGYLAQFGMVTGVKGYFAPYLELGANFQIGKKIKP